MATPSRSPGRSLSERLDAGTVICAEGYLFEFERRGYLQAGSFVPEVVLRHPEIIAQAHRDFVHAGSDVVLAFTYYGHRERLRLIGREHLLEQLNRDAIAIARNPRLIVADEPTASLDAWLRDQILELLISMCGATGASLVLLSHDLHLISRYCQRVAVMYGGRIVEYGERESVFHRQAHPYTRALLEAAPGAEGPDGRLDPIRGVPPVLMERSTGCAFAPRCSRHLPICTQEAPQLKVAGAHFAACHNPAPVEETE